MLELDGRAIGDSTAIIATLEEYRPEPALYPADAEERARALALDTRRVTLSFDQGRPEDREAIERLYKVARVLSHDADGDRDRGDEQPLAHGHHQSRTTTQASAPMAVATM